VTHNRRKPTRKSFRKKKKGKHDKKNQGGEGWGKKKLTGEKINRSKKRKTQDSRKPTSSIGQKLAASIQENFKRVSERKAHVRRDLLPTGVGMHRGGLKNNGKRRGKEQWGHCTTEQKKQTKSPKRPPGATGGLTRDTGGSRGDKMWGELEKLRRVCLDVVNHGRVYGTKPQRGKRTKTGGAKCERNLKGRPKE